MDLLSGMQAFVLVAETRSFVDAARSLGLTPSAISKLIARTEENLGVRLLHRSTRSISLTAEGGMFLQRCHCILDELDEARLELMNVTEAPRGRLRVSLPELSSIFLPVLNQFAIEFPEVSLDLDFTDRLVDVIEEGFDVVLRTGELSDSRLTARYLTDYGMCLVGSPEYFSLHAVPHCPDDLLQHDCIQYRFPSSGKTEVWPIKSQEGNDLRLRENITCNNSEARLGLALSGRGIACLPDFLVKEYIQQGKLISILQGFISWSGKYQLLWPSSRQRSPKLRAFIDFFALNAFSREK